MSFLSKAKREKKEMTQMMKRMQAARKQIYRQHDGAVRKLLDELGKETWGSRLRGKYHVGEVQLGKEHEFDEGPWGWYAGKGRRGDKSVPYGLGVDAPGKAEVYAVLITFDAADPNRGAFAVMYNGFGTVDILVTSDLSQETLQIALAEAFKEGPLDLVNFEREMNLGLRNILLNAEIESATERIKKMRGELRRMVKEAKEK